jgi:periplasmic divalent cation tolerance protein
MKTNAVQLTLTCGSWQEAQNVTDALLGSKLVACVEQLEVRSKNWWQGAIEDSKEIKLIMTSIAEKFDDIEAEVRKHHSYDTFVLHMLPVEKLNDEAVAWLHSIIAPDVRAEFER